ncbi:MAG: hypothetical protein Q9220_006168 [cf. Caloplaca sp. 1 TL-2023]
MVSHLNSQNSQNSQNSHNSQNSTHPSSDAHAQHHHAASSSEPIASPESSLHQDPSSQPALISPSTASLPSRTKSSLPTEQHHHLAHPDTGDAVVQLLTSQTAGPSSTKATLPIEQQDDLAHPDTGDAGDAVVQTSQAAGPSSTKDNLSVSSLHSSPSLSPTNSPPKEVATTPDLGSVLHSQLSGHLQRLVSPLFVDPYTDPSSVPHLYQPRLTSAKFRDLFRDDYEKYVALKPKGSLPSLFDLEMASPQTADLPKAKVDPAWVRARLKFHGLHQDDEAAEKRYPEVMEAAEKIINKPRDSYPTVQEIQRFKVKLAKYRTHNEDTFLLEILPFLRKEERLVPAAAGRTEDDVWIETTKDVPQSQDEAWAQKADIRAKEEQVSVTFDASGLTQIANRDFDRTILFFTNDSDLNKALAKKAEMTNPRPDRTFGIDSELMGWPKGFVLPPDIQNVMETIRSCTHVFLILEGKAAGGDLNEAKNQACRGGAVVVHRERVLRDHMHLKDKLGADLYTFIFSIVLTDQVVQIFVHWAEVHDAKDLNAVTYHMNLVVAGALDEKGTLGKVRKAIHNILDWGVEHRLHKQLKPVRDAIIARGSGGMEPASKKQKTNG